MKPSIIILSLLLQACFWAPCVNASEADVQWQDAVRSIKQGDYDFAFMNLKTILDNYPDSSRCMAAEFAIGEYFFLQKNYGMASDKFKDFYTRYPQRQESLIALVYLFKIAQVQNRPDDIKEYREKIASFRQLTFIFNEKRSFKFFSGFQRRYKLVYHINKVELYVNRKLFAEVSF
jgi:outer membrane protein assembly factor BamD (BamD/ComL family)